MSVLFDESPEQALSFYTWSNSNRGTEVCWMRMWCDFICFTCFSRSTHARIPIRPFHVAAAVRIGRWVRMRSHLRMTAKVLTTRQMESKSPTRYCCDHSECYKYTKEILKIGFSSALSLPLLIKLPTVRLLPYFWSLFENHFFIYQFYLWRRYSHL